MNFGLFQVRKEPDCEHAEQDYTQDSSYLNKHSTPFRHR
ncbi:hypothetical protein Z945_2324 [Sulfitobacter noctilucae]|nr:hypothetical protein Z945_2324 [Sulfitobacter noctilucae]